MSLLLDRHRSCLYNSLLTLAFQEFRSQSRLISYLKGQIIFPAENAAAHSHTKKILSWYIGIIYVPT